jgi:tripartite-type tricarboxylate transporter receptor subunit TctC
MATTAANSRITDAKQLLSTNNVTAGAAAGTISEFLIKSVDQKWIYTPYKGGSPMFTDLIGGHIDIGVNSTMGSYPHISSGKLRPVMVFSKNRMPQFPNVPTSYESGIPLAGEIWWGFLGTKNMPESVVRQLNKHLISIAKDPEFAEKITRQGATVLALDPDESQKYIDNDLKNLTKLYKNINQ